MREIMFFLPRYIYHGDVSLYAQASDARWGINLGVFSAAGQCDLFELKVRTPARGLRDKFYTNTVHQRGAVLAHLLNIQYGISN